MSYKKQELDHIANGPARNDMMRSGYADHPLWIIKHVCKDYACTRYQGTDATAIHSQNILDHKNNLWALDWSQIRISHLSMERDMVLNSFIASSSVALVAGRPQSAEQFFLWATGDLHAFMAEYAEARSCPKKNCSGSRPLVHKDRCVEILVPNVKSHTMFGRQHGICTLQEVLLAPFQPGACYNQRDKCPACTGMLSAMRIVIGEMPTHLIATCTWVKDNMEHLNIAVSYTDHVDDRHTATYRVTGIVSARLQHFIAYVLQYHGRGNLARVVRYNDMKEKLEKLVKVPLEDFNQEIQGQEVIVVLTKIRPHQVDETR